MHKKNIRKIMKRGTQKRYEDTDGTKLEKIDFQRKEGIRW